jgi:chromosomal replication initiation ATPase DnaA
LAALLVARRFEVALNEIGAPTRRSPEIARARQAAMYLAHVALGVPFVSVGAGFGRDRSTASYACRRVEDKRDDPAFDSALDGLEVAAQVALAHAEAEQAT